MGKTKEVLSDKEFLKKLGNAFKENKEIVTIGNTNQDILESMDVINEVNKAVFESQDQGYSTSNTGCISNA